MGNYDLELDLKSVNTMSVINEWIKKETSILEFGPANGRLTKYLKYEKNCTVTIVELDEESGKEAKQFATKSYIGKKYGNIENFYWTKSKQKFDYIIFADVLEHLSNPQKVLEACKNMLKPSGRILVSIPNVTHNSIIIDMLNDKFEYDDVGLLDRTHIHFFTLKTFQNMIDTLDIYISEMTPIYSRVGNNEIHNSYKDVPIDVQKFLRKRKEGSIYQYVFQLSLEKNEKCNISLKQFDIDEYEELESQCFYRQDQQEYSNEKRIEKIYRSNESVEWSLNLNDYANIEYIRIDPLENNGIIELKKCFIDKNGVLKDIQEINTNAIGIYNKIFVFDNRDPLIEIQIPKEFSNAKLHVQFEILDYGRENKEYFDLVQCLEKNGILFDEKNTNNHNLKLLNLHQQFVEQEHYNIHLEKDIKEQKDYITHLEKDIKEQKDYIAHLEKDIEVLKKENK